MRPQPVSTPPPVVVLYDGDCPFCRRLARFAGRRIKAGTTVSLCPLQSPQARHALARHGLTPAAFTSLVYLEGWEIEVRSTAVLRLCGHLAWPWHLFTALCLVPRPWRDRIYTWVAARRHWIER